MTARTHRDYLEDIQKAAAKAIEFLGDLDLDAFSRDEKTAFAVIRALEIVGEAAKQIPPQLRDRFPDIPWRAMAGIRDKLIHGYLTVSLDVVWKTVKEDMPVLVSQMEHVIEKEKVAPLP